MNSKQIILIYAVVGITCILTILICFSMVANSEPETKHYELTVDGYIQVESFREPTEEVVEQAEEKEVVQYEYFDVDLSENLQMHIFKLCEEYGVEPELVFALIEEESKYQADAVDPSGESFGLMQIQPKWHKLRMTRLNCNDLLEPFQNTMVGIDYLAELQEMNPDPAWVLMAFNGGSEYADQKFKNGKTSNYAKRILKRAEELKGERNG